MNTILRKGNSFINRILAMDAESTSELEKHNGRILAIEITGTGYHFHIRIVDGGVNITEASVHEPDVTVRGTPSEFMAFLRDMPEGRSRAASIEIAGDIGLAQELQGLIKRLEPDWEDYLSQWVGDTPARKLANLFRESRHYLAHARQTLRADVSEYLRYEAEVLPDRTEMDEFNAGVDTLRDDVERLRIRIERVSGKDS